MVEDGCMKGVDEVYGMHNVPRRDLQGKVLVQEGPMMAGFTKLKFRIIGLGGHGSKPEDCKNPVPVAAEVYLKINGMLDEAIRTHKGKLTGSLPKILGANALNVIPEDAHIEGTIRCFEKELPSQLVADFEKAAKEVCDSLGYEIEMLSISNFFKPVVNDQGPTDWVRNSVKAVYGEENLTAEGCPIFASEDFSDFTENVPGCFWFTAHGINEPHIT